jgi:hypothetical protein
MQLDHPYQNLTGGRWLRGNLHAHTNRTDGARAPQAVLDDYAKRGYDFLMLSDHDVFTSARDYAHLNARGMALIPGNEITANGPHLLHVNAGRRVEPLADRQLVLNEITRTRGFAILNHPNWQERFDHCSITTLTLLQGYAGIEIYNGVIGRLHGSSYALDKWDMLLTQGRRVWGFANDDSHRETGDVELGWNVVYSRQRTAAGIAAALRQGRFYASTGVVISKIQVAGRRIRLETTNADRIVAIQQVGKRFAQANARRIEVEVPDNATYVRFECWGRGEQFAWTQPFFLRHDKSPAGA